MKKLLSILLVFAISLFLVSCEGKGKIVIEKPKGAKVYINGKYVGDVPLEIELREGKYDITVEKEPFVEETKKNVQVYFDKTIVLSFNPTPKGKLITDTKPQGAEVWDNKEFLGKTPLDINLDPGLHHLYFYKGNLSAERKVEIIFKKTTKLFVNLEKALVHLDANPEDAKILIDGKPVNKIPTSLYLDEGVHKVLVEKGPYKDEFELKVKKGDEVKVSYELKPVQLPPVEAYGPVKFTHSKKYLVSMGKAGIYFWDINKFKPQISLYDPEDVRNFDKFINFEISENDEFVAGIKPIRRLAYALKEKGKFDKIIVWDLKTTAVKFSKLYNTISKFVFFDKDNNALFLIEKNGNIQKIDLKTGNISKIAKLGSSPTSSADLGEKILIGDLEGNIYEFNKNSNNLNKMKKVNGKISDIEISNDNNLVAIAYNKVSILDLNSLKAIKTFNIENPKAVALSPDKSLIAISIGKSVKVLDTNTGKLKYEIKDLPAEIISLKFRDNQVLITASSIETPYVGIWKNGHLLKKWVQAIE
ncbi:PEGA domain-containing protein [Hydrogenothermus marinus]|uniref:PEGA domain-containing protein n=1 Tax=Hydrogenothermus marinus TaxID=133270 RepID=A0A3M0BIU7_9AQUI|nr:PEGA domain-containing protein [Hydrogenothermus marinus]RMA97077.1 PEGA domain-containing protein [Hydrogenothermus marinus]